ncbi:DUF4123 domain-containing protein [Vibrio algivorus]|uniref:DUF4123 domain-containing protein n=1 Tax=Vibrio algivorus TaxID=1667024 RepID=A0A557NTM6_9VIBR|nr:DUF4123 domain-containing protein [Vibrio algivorus]TVO31781.1 DUF4123 domain-containing protein [Vibrio algivorus]
MLTSYFFNQEHAYWLVSSDIHQQAIKQNHQHGFPDALALFHSESFKQVMSYSPWLIPIQPELQHVDSDTFNQGIVLVSQAPMWDIVTHLRSLLYSALDGEEVMFRFYDPKVIVPMCATFTQDEINAFLGNSQQLACIQDGQLIIYHNTTQFDYQPHSETWWKIQPQHLEPLYKVDEHAKAIVSRLWEKLPKKINALPEPIAFFQAILQHALNEGINRHKAENIALFQFSKLTDTSDIELSQALMLTHDELKELQEIEKEVTSWEC